MVVSVPSGNFGNLTAGLIAKTLGLPIKRFIASTNANDTVPRYLKSGKWEPNATVATLSNAMDVSRPNNWPRVEELFKRNGWSLSDLGSDTLNDAETEAALKASGITYTILRNGWYTENYTASIPAALANNAFYGSAKNGKISSVLRAELAEAAVNVALSEGHENQTYELAGSTSWTLADLAAEISKQTGKDIPYVDIPAADYAAALVQAGLDEGFAGLIAQWDVDASNGALFSEDKTLEKLLGRLTAGLDVAVKQAL